MSRVRAGAAKSSRIVVAGPRSTPTGRPREADRERICRHLRSSGVRLTPARVGILEILLHADAPLSLQQITDAGGKDGPDYATVFRLMMLLEQRKIVARVNLERPESFFELRSPTGHYDHVVCTECGVVRLLEEACPLGPLEKAITDKYGFRNLRHSLEFFGTCAECSAKMTDS